MEHFISDDGQWKPTINFLKWEENEETFDEHLLRNGFSDKPFYKVGRSENLMVEAFAWRYGGIFEANKEAKQLVVFTCAGKEHFFYCTDIRALIGVLKELTPIVTAPQAPPEFP